MAGKLRVYTGFVNSVAAAHDETVHLADSMTVLQPWQVTVAPLQTRRRIDGVARFQAFMRLVQKDFGVELSKFQEEFLNRIAATLAPVIAGDDWATAAPQLARLYDWNLSEMSMIILGKGPRRFGKSTLCGLVCGALLLVCPGIKIAIFSVAQRISKYLADMVYKFICDAGYEKLVVKACEEYMVILGEHPLDFRVVYFYPANSRVSRSHSRPPLSLSLSRNRLLA